MTTRLWIDETTAQPDETSVALVELLSKVLFYKEKIQPELEAIKEIDLAAVRWPGGDFSARVFWSGYVLDLRQAGLLKPLVSHMATRFPAKKADFLAFLMRRTARLATSWYEVQNPLEAQFVGTGAVQPMINRRRLRDELCKLHKDGFRTMNITGGSSSGKTFSFQLVRALAQRERFPVLLVDVADWGSERFTARHLVDRIASHRKFTVPADAALAAPDAHTRARELMTAVEDHFPEAAASTPWWLVIDGLDRANVDLDARAFVEKLLRSVDVNGRLGEVRLVVTGFDGLLPPQTCREAIGAITRGDVRELFEVSAAQLDYPATDAELDEWTDRVWNAYDPAVDDLTDLGALIYQTVRDELLGART